MHVDEKSRMASTLKQKALEGNIHPGGYADLADTVVYDAIDRLTGINHFISFKNRLPMQYNLPEDMEFPMENEVYSPSSRIVRSGNGLLKFCADGTDFYRKHYITSKHHYVYGVSYATSEFEQRITETVRRQADGSFAPNLELSEFGVSFEPLSVRKLWVNPLLTAYNMDYQHCPFFFEEVPRFAIVANTYDEKMNPFGYVNLDTLPNATWLFSGTEMASWKEALTQNHPDFQIPNINRPDLAPELKWVLYPMLPLRLVPASQELIDKARLNPKDDPVAIEFIQKTNQIWEFDNAGTQGVPLSRYVMEMFGTSLIGGEVEFIRVQQNYYPNNAVPIYGSSHMPDLDSGQYSPSLGDILESHYEQICKALNQYIDNKNLINDPPVKIQLNSPCIDADINKPGSKNRVNSLNDYEKDTPVDATQTTPMFLQMARDQAKTTSKATDSVIGAAMGARTTATEATNVFQIAMSGVTTDINLFNHDIAGGYALRVWDYLGLWADPDLVAAITGQYGFQLKPEHMAIRIGIVTDIGSTFIESIQRQTNIREILAQSAGDPSINRAYLWRALLKEWRFPDIDKIVNDGGVEKEILQAANQAELTYLGDANLVIVDPEQNHQIAKKVKISYLKDRDSVWNTKPEFAINAKFLVDQIRQHDTFIMLQYYQMLAQQMQQSGNADPAALQQLQSQMGASPQNPLPSASTGGQVSQNVGGSLA